MDSIRYFLAAVLVISLPPAYLYWFLIHPFARFWRRIGVALTFLAVGVVCAGLAGLLWWFRSSLVLGDLGFKQGLAILALPVYSVAVAIEVATRRHLTSRILIGLPELKGEASGTMTSAGPSSPLLTEGIYRYTRNPRYVAILVALAAFALAVNYSCVWLLWLASFPALLGIVVFEERELRARYGSEYEDYLERVPRFVPRFFESSRRY